MNAIDQQRPPEAPDAAGVYRIWPGEGRAPGSEHWTHRESTMQIPWTTASRRLTRNVVIPSLTAFLPEPGKATGTAMIVASSIGKTAWMPLRRRGCGEVY